MKQLTIVYQFVGKCGRLNGRHRVNCDNQSSKAVDEATKKFLSSRVGDEIYLLSAHWGY